MESNLKEISKRVSLGDTDLFASFFSRNREYFIGFIQKKFWGVSEDSEDLVQELYIKMNSIVQRRGYQYMEGKANIRSYCVKVLTNMVYDIHRRGRIESYSLNNFVHPETGELKYNIDPKEYRTPEYIINERARVTVLDYAIQSKLTDAEREIVRMRLAGIKFDVIAESLNKNPITARTTHRKAVVKLRKSLRDNHESSLLFQD